MKAYVFTDKSLERYAGRFVWLSIDTENAKNAAFLKKYPMEGVPTFFIFDPKKEQVAVRWLGSATVPQLVKLFEDGQRAVGGTTRDPLLEKLAAADKLYGAGKNPEAAKAYDALLAEAPKDWSRRGRVTESLLFSLQSSEQFERCAKVSADAWAKHKDTASAMNIAAVGLDCAVSLEKETAGRAALIGTLERNANSTMDNPNVKVAADDRSGLYQVLIGAREDAGDKEGQRSVTEKWAAFLEGEAGKAKNAEARAVFDSHRLSAYLALEQPERAIPMLEASERDFPNDYNPPARLAAAYRAMKQYDAALAASDRALAKAYGPRKVTILRTRIDILVDKGDKEEAKKVAQQALELAESMPEGQRSERTIAAIRKKIESIQ